MSIVTVPTVSATMSAGSILGKSNACVHTFEPAIVQGTVAVIGAGKIGLPLCAQFVGHSWNVVAVDNNPAVVVSINRGESHIGDEPKVAKQILSGVEAGWLYATGSIHQAVSKADVVVVIIPVAVDENKDPDFTAMDRVVEEIGASVQLGTIIIFETTVPIGTTRNRYVPMLEMNSGMKVGVEFYVAFSPERVSSGSIISTLNTYPKLVGGVNKISTQAAAEFYDAVLDTEVVKMTSSEEAEFAKLMDTTYRDVNIALASEFATIADNLGLDVQEVISAANSQPYSNVHQPGIGVGGHCIPVYPHMLMASTGVDTPMIALARTLNDMGIYRAVDEVQQTAINLEGRIVLVLGLTYRDGVKELAYSRAIPLIKRLKWVGATVFAWDPLLTENEIRALGVEAWSWGVGLPAVAIISQTADPMFEDIDVAWFPGLEVIYDGRNSLRKVRIPADVRYVGVGIQGNHRLDWGPIGI